MNHSLYNEKGYFNGDDISSIVDRFNCYYHEFEYQYSNYKGEWVTGHSQFYYYTDNNNVTHFTFTHAFTDIYVYAVYKMVEYDTEVTIIGDYGSTYYTTNGVEQTNNPPSGIEDVTFSNDKINLSDSYNYNSITYADRVNYKGTYRETQKFPLFIGATEEKDFVTYNPTLFVYSNNYGKGANGTDNTVDTENNQDDDDLKFINNDLECGRRAKANFKYNQNDPAFTVTTVQNNNLILFVYLREGYRLNENDVKLTFDKEGLGDDKNKYSFNEYYNPTTREYR